MTLVKRRSLRTTRMVVVEREEEQESSEEEEEEEEEEDNFAAPAAGEAEADDDDDDNDGDSEGGADEEEEKVEVKTLRRSASSGRKGQKKISPIKLKKGVNSCKVCGEKDHRAGFVGAVYMDCPNKPCYLCKQTGHTTLTCPYRTAPEHGVRPAARRQSGSTIDIVREREIQGRRREVKWSGAIPDRVDAAVLKLHSRRITSMEFHPTKDNIVLSGDKKGQLAVWDFEKVYEKTVYESVHTCLVNNIRFHVSSDDKCYTAASDGTVRALDIETGDFDVAIDLNPHGWQGAGSWRMFYGCDIDASRNVLLAGDDAGNVHMWDLRTKKRGQSIQLHAKGSKVVSLQVHPFDSSILLSASNDHTARIWDMRKLASGEHLASMQHPRVVNSAYFSPQTGSKILSTCQDNRLRVWDYIYGDLSVPSREIVHSHDFNRYLSPFKAEWDPRDPTECLVVVGRYISDDYNGVPLHPIDFIDASTGQLVASVVDPNVTTITPVNKMHPRLDVLASGSSRSIYIWRPKEEELNASKQQVNKRSSEVILFDAEEVDTTKKKKMKGKTKE